VSPRPPLGAVPLIFWVGLPGDVMEGGHGWPPKAKGDRVERAMEHGVVPSQPRTDAELEPGQPREPPRHADGFAGQVDRGCRTSRVGEEHEVNIGREAPEGVRQVPTDTTEHLVLEGRAVDRDEEAVHARQL
jgi:hypothetical protein